MDSTSRTPRYLTLRDYLRVLRRYRVAIVVIALIGAAAGYFTAKRETPVYQATATASFQDPLQELAYIGLSGAGGAQSQGAIAGQVAETLTRPQVLSQLKRNLSTSLPMSRLSGALSGQVTAAGFLDIQARWSNPQFASRLANAEANVLVNQANGNARTQFSSIAQATRRRIAQLSATVHRSPLLASQLQFSEGQLAQLDTLVRVAHTASVQQTAQPPSTPVSPKTTRSAVIGGVLGLLLAIAIAFFRDSMDRRLRTPRDIESSFQLPVIGHVRDRLMGQIAHTANGAVDHAVDIEAFRILRRNLEFLGSERQARSVVVTSAVPEEGKTTVAGSLAFVMAAAGRKTLLVDCDLRRPALASRLGIEPAPGISDFLAGQAAPEQIIRPVQFNDPPTRNGAGRDGAASSVVSHGLVCIPAGSPTSRAAELLGSSRFREFLEQVSAVYDIVVIDSSPVLPVADTLEILPLVDEVIICARERRTTRDEALAARTALSRFPDRPTGIVVTGIDPRRKEYEVYDYKYAYS